MIPRPKLLAVLLGAVSLMALGDVSVVFVLAGAALTLGVVVLAVVDLRAAPRFGAGDLVREAPPQLSIGVPHATGIRAGDARAAGVAVRDEAPVSFQVEPRVVTLRAAADDGPVAGGGATGGPAAGYAARPRHRGTYRYGALHVRARGPLGLVERQSRVPADAPAHVYPDLREIHRYEVTLRRGLAYGSGQRRSRVPGAGRAFERLREYEPDDDPRSISWTATARRGRPISVEYEAERQQRVLVLLDAGRMMSSTLGELTKLDHAVNTALMLAYVAERKGDEVGLLGFSDTVRSYLVPRRGRRQFLRVTEELRRLEVTTTETDYRAAFEFLRSRTARRSLVVLFTDLVDDEPSRGLVASVTRLAGSNLVLCCLLGDPRLGEVAAQVPSTTRELYERVVAQEVRDARAKALATLRQRGVHVLDVPADKLTAAAIGRYLELKQRAL